MNIYTRIRHNVDMQGEMRIYNNKVFIFFSGDIINMRNGSLSYSVKRSQYNRPDRYILKKILYFNR